MRSVLEAALAYAARGWLVFPCFGVVDGACTCSRGSACLNAGKHPITRNGLKDATTDAEQINEWFEQHPTANVAIVTGAASGIVVVDLDVKPGKNGIESLDALNLDLPPTAVVTTGSGGRHLYFAHPGGSVPCSSGKLGLGIDVRGDDGYVIAPPSRHVSGGVYAW